MTQWIALSAILAAVACRSAKPAEPSPEKPVEPSSADDAGSPVVQTPGEATRKDLAAVMVASGCASVADCDVAPVGLNTCGHTNDYVVFCKTTTDMTRFEAILREINSRDEERFGDRREFVGHCYNPSPPSVELVDGTCREKEVDMDDDEFEVTD